MIYHFTTHPEWKAALQKGIYTPANFEKDGFIHCSDHFQLTRTAQKFCQGVSELIVLEIDPDAVKDALRYEKASDADMPFPHLYAPLGSWAVKTIHAVPLDSEGRPQLPASLLQPEIGIFTEFPFGLPGRAFRSRMPGSSMFDPRDEVFPLYLENNIHTVVVLNEPFEFPKYTGGDLLARYQKAGLRVIHCPTQDFFTPQKGAWDEALLRVAQLLREGHNVAIHCHAGIGRTGMFTAILAQELLNLSPADSILWVRKYSPTAIDTFPQKQLVLDYWTRGESD